MGSGGTCSPTGRGSRRCDVSIFLDVGIVLFAATLALIMWRRDQDDDERKRLERRRQEIIDRISRGL